jgi:hypothetical protein
MSLYEYYGQNFWILLHLKPFRSIFTNL